MKIIPKLHNFIDALPEEVRAELVAACIEREVAKHEAVYRQGDPSNELYQLLAGGVRMCNYTRDGREVVMVSFRPGDCFGEMGMIDGMPRMSHAIAAEASRLRVLPRAAFRQLYQSHPQISQQLNRMFALRIRMLSEMNEEVSSLGLRERLARMVHRLAYSHGLRDEAGGLHIGTSHEELGRLLGASRQSVSKELKGLEQEGSIALRYGKIYILSLDDFNRKYEPLLGQEQVSTEYPDAGGS